MPARVRAAAVPRVAVMRSPAAARSFTAFARRRGWLAADPGPQLGTLKTRRALPHVLRQDEIGAVLDAAGRRADAARTAAQHAASATGDAAPQAGAQGTPPRF